MRRTFVAVITVAVLAPVPNVNAATEIIATGGASGSVATSGPATHFASHRRGHQAFGGPPPADYDGLYRWCVRKLIVRYGRRDPIPGEPRRMILPSRNGIQMADACVQSHGAVY